MELDVPPAAEGDVAGMREALSRIDNREVVENMLNAMRKGKPGQRLNNDTYRLKLPEPGSSPFANVGRAGYEAESRELMRLAKEVDQGQG